MGGFPLDLYSDGPGRTDPVLPDYLQIPSAEYDRLQSALDQWRADTDDPDVDVIILPGGGADLLYAYLDCGQCGVFVCYRHNPELKPAPDEAAAQIIHPRWERLSRSVPMRIIRQFSDRLEVKPDA